MNPPPVFSVIIPAYNEVEALPETLAAVRHAVELWARPVEIRVVDNASTDGTAELARDLGADVVFEPRRQIARARNRGAESARGEIFLFCDADTQIHPETLTRIHAEMLSGRLAGGGIRFLPDDPLWEGSWSLRIWNFISRTLRISGGTLFVRADVFRALGGFPERFFVGEETALQFKMKAYARRRGLRTVLLWDVPARTSMRKFRDFGFWRYNWAVLRCLLFPWLATRKRFCDLWYEVRSPERKP